MTSLYKDCKLIILLHCWPAGKITRGRHGSLKLVGRTFANSSDLNITLQMKLLLSWLLQLYIIV